MEIILKEVVSNKDLKKFIDFPYKLYAGNKFWIPQLRFDEMNLFNPKKNPAFEFCNVKLWLVYKDNKVAGRVAGIINRRFIEKWQDKYCRFGWIDFIDDENVSRALLDAVENWAEENEMEAIHGPLGFTDLDPEGMLIEGFEELGTIATIYNYPYYHEHIRKLGYQKDADWIEFELKIPDRVPEKIERISKIILKKQKLRIIRTSKKKDMKPYLTDMFDVLNKAYEELYGFVSLTEKQVKNYIKQYISFTSPEYICLIVDEHDKVAAFGITVPSLSKAFQKAKGHLFPFGVFHILKALKKNNLIDLYLIAVRPDLQGKGVNSLLFSELIKIYIDHKFEKAESNPELETNTKVQAQWKFFDRRQHKRRRCFTKQLR